MIELKNSEWLISRVCTLQVYGVAFWALVVTTVQRVNSKKMESSRHKLDGFEQDWCIWPDLIVEMGSSHQEPSNDIGSLYSYKLVLIYSTSKKQQNGGSCKKGSPAY